MSTAPIYSFTDTWNAAGTVFDGIKLVITNTASAAGSDILDLSITGGASIRFDKTGVLRLSDGTNTATLTPTGTTGLTLDGALTAGGNIALGANYISRAGTNAGLSLDASNNVTASASLTATTSLLVGTGTGTEGGDNNLIKCGAASAFLNIKGGTGNAKMVIGNDAFDFIGGATGTINIHYGATSSTNIGTLTGQISNTTGNWGLGSTFAGLPPEKLSVIGSIASYNSTPTYTTSNYERLRIVPETGNFGITAETGGTGTADISITLTPAGTKGVGIGTTPTYKFDVQGSTNGAVIRAASNNSGDILYYGTGTVTGSADFFRSSISATTGVIGVISNSNNSSSTANAALVLSSTGANGGDPATNYTISGAFDWVVGVDNSNSDAFVIGAASAPGSNDALCITTSKLICLGGITSAYPALKRSSTELQVRLADDSAYAAFACAALTVNADSTLADGVDIALNTTTGSKIGTATTQKLGFWNTTPVVQPTHIADPAGGATVDAEARTAINAINAMLAATGLTAAA